MGFIDSYKHLEKICGEILKDDRRINAYIDEMENTPKGSRYVSSWNEDLKRLKHYRWVRNQIVHEPNCNESNMCAPQDELWLNNFYSRIMNGADPLTLYRKSALSQKKPSSPQPQPVKIEYNTPTYMNNRRPHKKHNIKIAMGFLAVGFALLAVIIYLAIKM